MSDRAIPHQRDRDARPPSGASIDELLEGAVAAINRGDRAAATALAGQVLAVDRDNADAEDLLSAPADAGQIRRLTILFADLVDSTVLSTRVEPETYRLLVGRYRDQVVSIVNRFEGHVGSTKGDGLLAGFGHPSAHEDDVRRAVLAGLEITRQVSRLSEQAKRRFGFEITVRVGVHRGLVYLDTAQDDVYGLAANLAARVSGLAPPGTVVVSDAIEPLLRDAFELQALPAATVKGVDGLIAHHLRGGRALRADDDHPWSVGGSGPRTGATREQLGARAGGHAVHAGGGVPRRARDRQEPSGVAAADFVADSGVVLPELIGSPFHTDTGLHPVRGFIEKALRDRPFERSAAAAAAVERRGHGRRTGSRNRGAVVGAGVGHRRCGRL